MVHERSAIGQLLYDLFGRAARAVGEEFGSQVEEFIARQNRRNLGAVAKRAHDCATEHGVDLRDAPPTFVIRALDAARKEHDRDIQQVWARLLVAGAENPEKYARPVFITALETMTPEDARVFNAFMSNQPLPQFAEAELDAAVLTLSSLGLAHHTADYGINSRTGKPMLFEDWTQIGRYMVAKSHLGVFLYEALTLGQGSEHKSHAH